MRQMRFWLLGALLAAGCFVGGGRYEAALQQTAVPTYSSSRAQSPETTVAWRVDNETGPITLPEKPVIMKSVIGLLALLMVFAATCYLNFGRIRLAQDYWRADEASVDGRRIARKTQLLASQNTTPAPRNLLQNPFSQVGSRFSLEEQVEFAIQASVRAGRVIGVIHFHLTPVKQVGSLGGGAQYNQSIDTVAAALREKLRMSDHVQVIGPSEILTFVTLLSELQDLNRIAKRLFRSARCFKCFNTMPPGVAIYPLNGYSCEELIMSAKMHKLKAA